MFATLGGPVISFRLFRDAVTFLFGLGLATYEVVTAGDSEPSLIVLGLAATMMGLPGSLGVDRLLNRGGEPSEPTPPVQAVPDPPATPTTPPSSRRHGR